MKRSKIIVALSAIGFSILGAFTVNGHKPYTASVYYWSLGVSSTCMQLCASHPDFNIVSPAGSQTAKLKRSDGVMFDLYSDASCVIQVKFK